MSKVNPSGVRSTRRGAKSGLPTQPMPAKSVRFTLDNEEVHEVSLNTHWENECADDVVKEKART